MLCPKCRAEINENDKFCKNCGANLGVPCGTKSFNKPLIHVIAALVLIAYIFCSSFVQQNKNTTNTPQVTANTITKENETKAIELENQKKQYEQKLNQAKKNIGTFVDKIENRTIYYEKNCYEELKKYKFVRPMYICPAIKMSQENTPILMGALLYLTEDDYVPFSSTVWYTDGISKEVDIPLDFTTQVFDYDCPHVRYFPVDVALFDKVAKSKEVIVRLKLLSSKLDYDLTDEEKIYIKNMTEFYKLLANQQ